MKFRLILLNIRYFDDFQKIFLSYFLDEDILIWSIQQIIWAKKKKESSYGEIPEFLEYIYIYIQNNDVYVHSKKYI